MYTKDIKSISVKKKRKLARECFNKKYETRLEREENSQVLSDALYQIRVCEDLCCPVSESMIKDWINSGNSAYIARKAREIKFAS